MKDIFAIYKRVGETPLQALDRVRFENGELLRDAKLSYAGRLDPLAQGVMLVLKDEANKERDRYLQYDKSYYFDVLFGIGSDSYDPLGLVKKGSTPTFDLQKKLEKKLSKWRNIKKIQYPPFSSKTVDGRSLFCWAREGRSFTLPKREIRIYEFEITRMEWIPFYILRNTAYDKISRVKGDFRQREVYHHWQILEKEIGDLEKTFPVARFYIEASTGTYVRSLAHKIGEECGTSALAFHIVRTSVGPFSL